MVLSYHYVAGLAVVPEKTFFSRAQRILQGGWTGVDLFFILSGFLIAGILIDKQQSPSRLSTFYIRRACRIFPIYFLLLLSYSILLPFGMHAGWGLGLFTDPLPTWPYYVFLQNTFMAVARSFGAGWLGVTWSLAVEEQFYLILPFLVHRFSSPKNLVRLALLFIVIGPVSRALVAYGMHIHNWMFTYPLLPTRCDALGVGMLIAILYRSRDAWGKITNARWPIVGAVVAAVVLPTAVIFGFAQERTFVLSYTFIACSYALLLISAIVSDNPVSRVLSWRPVRFLGNLSYSTYLLHPLLLRASFYVFRQSEPQLRSWNDMPLIGVALAATLLLSWMSWSFIERPFLSLGHRFRYEPARNDGVREFSSATGAA
jgi:peptidoglycan/LPS O-acetylase OafA/YrhL